MQVFAAARALGVALLGGTLIGFVPEPESRAKPAPVSPAVSASDAHFAAGASCPLPAVDLAWADDPAPEQPTQLAAAEGGVQVGATKKEHVKAKVFLSVDKLPAGDKCKFVVILDVEEGWHINANPPSPDNMIPTKITIESKHKSKQLATKYPEGAELTIDELPDPVSVYEGEVHIRGEIQAAKDAAGKQEELEFQIRYQACNEKTCLPPKTLKLAGKIEIVKPGTAVKQINQKYFPAKK